MKTVLFLLAGVIGLVFLLLLAALLRTLFVPRRRAEWTAVPQPEREAKYAQKLSQMVQFETVSVRGEDQTEKFRAFHQVLKELFPLVFSRLEVTEIDGNLLLHWAGRSSERPIVLLGHQDVVPADGEWLHSPFSGDIADGKIWGRGSADTKGSVMAFFQAVEELLEKGYVPEQDVWLSSSCTEEYAGTGCSKLVAELKRRGVQPFLVCDEGGAIIEEPVGGCKGRFAMIGIFEKGQANLRFTARSSGGHASSPPRHSPIARLAAFVTQMEKHSPFRKKLLPSVKEMFSTLAPFADFPLRFLFGNLWLFGPLLERLMPLISPQGAAMLQTTAAFTMASGSEACNVLPQEASVSANLRFIPHQGMEESIAIVQKRAEAFGLETEVIAASDYTPPVDTQGEAWQRVLRSVHTVFPGLETCPYVMTGGTDARFYQEICPSCIRFAPLVFGREQMKGMHGINENISAECLPGAVDFYKVLIGADIKEL